MKQPTTSESLTDGLEEVTSLFAKQNLHTVPTEHINELPPEERSQALYDLHAVPDPWEETPDLINRKLTEMGDELKRIETKVALDEATQQSLEYVNSWKLRFLRAERFDTTLAAERMVLHFETKKSMFGLPALGRNISVEDLSETELEDFKTGFLQVMSHRDQGGRAVFVEMGTFDNQCPIDTMVKLQFLLAAVASEDTEVQRKGVVIVFYAVGRKIVHKDRTVKDVHNWLSLPLRLVAIHGCYDNVEYHEVMTIASHAMAAKYMCRHKSHYGTHTACQSNLAMYGIPKHTIPLLSDGTIDRTNHERWMKQAHKSQPPKLEDAPKQSGPVPKETEVILMAGPQDVIMGRGNRKHSGNLKLRRFLKKHRTTYEAENWLQKRNLCESMYLQLIESGVRFISHCNGGAWERIGDEAAVDKIAHVFRDMRRVKRQKSA